MKKIRIKVIDRYEDRLRDIYAKFYLEDAEDEGFTEVDPIIENIPDGKYQVRGNERGYSSEYAVLYGKWILLSRSIDDCDYDGGISVFNIVEFNLIPPLSSKEWEHIEKTGLKRLSPLWRKYLRAYWINLNNMDLRREIKRHIRAYKLEEE
jgi:hypothetical protein